MENMVGKVLGGRYELLEEVGMGGMAVVYKAKCRLLNRIVAVKILRTDLEGNDEFLKRFNIEAQSAASLTHPNIVSVYDVGAEGQLHYIVMEYVEGITLKDFIRDNAPLGWKRSVKIAMEIGKALEEAHKKHIVHRDIKPQNIIVTKMGAIKVTDFGIARAATASTISVDNDVLGSVHYISPEQARGGYVDEKSDIYSLGVVLYEMLTGHVPFDAETPVAIAMKHIEEPPVSPAEEQPDIPQSVADITIKAMAKDTRSRYQSVTEFMTDLVTVLVDPNGVTIVEPPAPVDVGATRKMEPVKVEKQDTEVVMANKKGKKKKKLDKEDKRAVVAAIITSLLIVGLLSVFAAKLIFPEFSVLSLFGFGQSSEIEVPNLLTMTVEQAEKQLQGSNFTLKVKEDPEDSDQPEGTIIEQYPKGGRKVKGKHEIEVTLSNGKGAPEAGKEFALNNYKSEEYRQAQIELERLGLDVVIEWEKDSTVAEGYIIRQTPAEGTKVKKGDKITLVVSQIADSENVIVPTLIGMTQSQAKRELEKYNLTLGAVSHEPSNRPKGQVIGQSIAGGDSVGVKTAVKITLSSGPEEDEPDEPSNGSQGGTTNDTPSTSGNTQQKEQTLSISLPQDKDSVSVRITSGGSTVYEGTHNPQQTPEISRTVRGSGKVTYDVYIDGQKVGSKTIDFK